VAQPQLGRGAQIGGWSQPWSTPTVQGVGIGWGGAHECESWPHLASVQVAGPGQAVSEAGLRGRGPGATERESELQLYNMTQGLLFRPWEARGESHAATKLIARRASIGAAMLILSMRYHATYAIIMHGLQGPLGRLGGAGPFFRMRQECFSDRVSLGVSLQDAFLARKHYFLKISPWRSARIWRSEYSHHGKLRGALTGAPLFVGGRPMGDGLAQGQQ
jgi:hypothetical protein